MRWLARVVTALLPLICGVVYAPINRGYMGAALGGGCRSGFNANTFNGILFVAILGVSVGFLVLASRGLGKWGRIAYLTCGLLLQCVSAYACWMMSSWR